MDPIDLTIDSPFHSSVWIGAGKRFSNSIPREVLVAKERTLEIPEIFHRHLPPPAAYVRDFVGLDLPFQSYSLDFHATTDWFSHDTPHTDPIVLIARLIPSAKVLETLKATAGQVWLDGGHSIVDPRFNNGVERFPLWALSLWKEAQKMARCQGEWNKSLRWLDSITHPAVVIVQVKDIINRLSWNRPLSLRGATSLDLAGFLGTSWLSGIQIDMMVSILQERAKAGGCNGGALIELVAFSQEITSVAKGMKLPTSKYLLRLTDDIKKSHMKTLWFPIHVNDSHWIAGRVDLEKRTFAFGDSMVKQNKGYPLHEVLSGLRKWLDVAFGWKLANEGNVLARPYQTDTVSCSVCAMNTIAHNVFGDELWEQRDAAVHRVSWILKFYEYKHLEFSVEPTNPSFPHANAERCPETLDTGGITGRAREPPVGNLDTPAASTSSSVTSIDKGENPELIGRRKRKHDLLITSPSNTKVTRRFFRTYAGCNGPEQIEESHQETPPTTPDIDVQVVRVADLVIDPVKGRIEPGTSSSAQASRKIRNEANNGTYVAGGKKLENWRRKIRKLDPDVKFDEENSRKVFHTRCAQWLLVKEPGDTTRFKEHLQACRVKLVPVEGTCQGHSAPCAPRP